MTQEEKQLLLKDLCARLPYGVNLRIEFYDLQGDGKLASRDVKLTAGNIGYCFGNSHWVDIKPYLRPMSSMTEEEREEVKKHMKREQIVNVAFYHATEETYDWYNSHHFDYRGLIEKGLALEASDGMYKTE